MATNIFTRANASFLTMFARPRFCYEQANHRLTLFIECTAALPPSWFTGLRIEVIGDDSSIRLPISFVWTEIEDSLLVAHAICPETLRPGTDSDMVPISRLTLIAGSDEVTLENMRSPKAFAARAMNPQPII